MFNRNKYKKPLYKRILIYLFPYKGDSIKEIIRKFIFLISIIAIILSSIYIINYLIKHIDTTISEQNLQTLYDNKPTKEQLTNLPEGVLEQYAGLMDINPDIVGWIKIQNTKINHPVVQSKDNDFYLYKDFNKKYDDHGIPFADFRNNMSKNNASTNTILYAHNINGGRLFGDINKFRKISFYKENPLLEFNSLYENRKYKILSVFITDVDQTDPNFFNYHDFIENNSDSSFNQYIKKIKDRELYDTKVDVNSNDKLLTLSTCINEIEGSRLVLVARQIRSGESENVDTSNSTVNPNPIYPNSYYKKYGNKIPSIN